jgi:CheY-like chemotaxis protein
MKTIMIVGDESTYIDGVKSSLLINNFNVLTARNNREALRLISDEHAVSLILVNAKMPDGNNRAFFPLKPTSRMNMDTSNITDFLQYPFTEQQLLKFIKERL